MKLRTALLSVVPAAAMAILLGCSTSAESDEPFVGSAALLTAQRGALGCWGTKALNNSNRFTTVFNFTNDNDSGTISIDKVVVYKGSAVSLCPALPGPIVLGPHESWGFSVATYPPYDECIPEASGGQAYFRFIVYWSRPSVALAHGLMFNGLDGWDQTVITNADTGALITRVQRDCKELILVP